MVMLQQKQLRGKNGGRHNWEFHVRALSESGLSRAEYCRRHNLSARALGYWQVKLRPPEPTEANPSQLVAVMIPAKDPARSFDAPASLHLLLPGNLSIAVGDHFSPQTLNRLLATLERR
jgi:hypothetical protein